ncbi:MAG: FAD-dependent oxidoreductase [Novosphingobium sp.]
MSTTETPRLAVLGAGPAGIAAAFALARRQRGAVSLYERAPVAGGNSASFDVAGVRCDYGSHRFHPAAGEEIIGDVRALLGDDLLLRPRHGRIRLGGRWIHFPLKPLDAILHLPPRFVASLLGDSAAKPFRKKTEVTTFSDVLRGGLGPTISENFYFPYVRKLWGLDPDALAVTLAYRRVSSGSVGKILAKMAKMLPGLRSETSGRFYYPREGFGQIGEAMLKQAETMGAEVRLGAEITAIRHEGGRVTGIAVADGASGTREVETDLVLSTLPLTMLVRLLQPAAPPEVVEAAKAIRFRGMILIYLVLGTDQFTEYDAHYLPELSIPISRMSEPKNYNATGAPAGRTVLCAELPCDPHEKWWGMSDEELGKLYCEWLGQLGLPVNVPVLGCETRRLNHAYPVYDIGYEPRFAVIDEWLSSLEGLLVFGRQGLFAHDNTHHAFAMAYAAADVVRPDGSVDRAAWAEHRHEFETHTVED